MKFNGSRYEKILTADIANGVGFRVTVWLTGCPIRCKGCFNSQLWDKETGKPVTEETFRKVEAELKKDWIDGITLLGGEPLAEWNIETSLAFAKLAHRVRKNCLDFFWLRL